MTTITKEKRKEVQTALKRASLAQQCGSNAKLTSGTWRLETDCKRMSFEKLMEQLGRKTPKRQLRRIGGKAVAYEAAVKKVEFGRRSVKSRAQRIADICQSIARERNPTPIINHISTVLPKSTVADIVTSDAFLEHAARTHYGLFREGTHDPLDRLIAKEELDAVIGALEREEERTGIPIIKMEINSLRR